VLTPDGSTIFIGSEDHSVYALDAASGTLRWNYTTSFQVESSAVLSPDNCAVYRNCTVYVGSDDGAIYALYK
jgi:outer membrane protein assembly factor BamB